MFVRKYEYTFDDWIKFILPKTFFFFSLSLPEKYLESYITDEERCKKMKPKTKHFHSITYQKVRDFCQLNQFPIFSQISKSLKLTIYIIMLHQAPTFPKYINSTLVTVVNLIFPEKGQQFCKKYSYNSHQEQT